MIEGGGVKEQGKGVELKSGVRRWSQGVVEGGGVKEQGKEVEPRSGVRRWGQGVVEGGGVKRWGRRWFGDTYSTQLRRCRDSMLCYT